MGISKEAIERINKLAKKAREEGLTEEEKAEQKQLREDYAAACRENLRAALERTSVVGPDGSKRPLRKKKG